MWLLDVNVPRKLVDLLAADGVRAHTAESRGWKDLTNGELVEAAVGAGLTGVLTRDRLCGASAARTLRRFPGFCVILITLPQLRGDEFLERFQAAWREDPIQPAAGALVRWPGP